jgi:hypothetical protein
MVKTKIIDYYYRTRATRRRRISRSVFNLQVCNTPEYTKEHNTETISSGAFSLSPGGGTNYFYMNVQSNAVNARLTDSYSLSGGILSLISVYLLDPAGSDIVNEISPSGQIVKL